MSEGLEARSLWADARKSKIPGFEGPDAGSSQQLRKRPPEYMIPTMNQRSVFAVALLAASPAFAAEPSRQSSPEFQAFPLSERNLTRSGASWESVGSNGFDVRATSRIEVRTLRDSN